jgi:hypothetical protein
MKIEEGIHLKCLGKLKNILTHMQRQAMEDTHCTENETSKNEQVANEGFVFSDIRGVFLIEWVQECQMDSQIICLELLTKL